MTGTPWLNDDGTYVCFYCTTGTTRAGRECDPDSVHAGLRESHRILLSRPLPNGDSWSFQRARGWYLTSVEPRTGEPLEWSVGSDNFATTHTNARPGMAEKISDRFDLTLEAIRLFFDGKTSRDVNPLGDVLDAYGWFLEPFGAGDEGFRAYVDYFFLATMVSGGRVRPTYGNEPRPSPNGGRAARQVTQPRSSNLAGAQVGVSRALDSVPGLGSGIRPSREISGPGTFRTRPPDDDFDAANAGKMSFGLRHPYLIECSGNPSSPGQSAAYGSRANQRRASSRQVRVERRKAIGMPRRGSPRAVLHPTESTTEATPQRRPGSLFPDGFVSVLFG